MNNFPKISVVMLNYNGLEYLKRTIPPVLDLEYSNYEFIIVDNGSTDGSIEYIQKFKKIILIKSPRLREKNFACNYAIERARGQFILLMDNDALLTNRRILNELLGRYNKKIGAIGLSFYDDNSTQSKSYGSYLGYYFIKEGINVNIEQLNNYDKIKIGFPEGKAFFISKEKWILVGGYDENLKFGGDDNDIGIKLWLFGYENNLYSRTLQVHLGLPERQDNLKYALKWQEMFCAHLYTIVKNYSFFNMIVTMGGYSVFGFLKSMKQGVKRRNFPVFLAFFKGYYLFFRKLPVVIRRRREIQRKRVVKEDIFLKIKPPKIK